MPLERNLTGREHEIKDLRSALDSEVPEFVAVVGRRRVGKTFLIKQVYGGSIVFELTGIQHATKSDQLKNFFYAFRTHFPYIEVETHPSSWLDAFFMLSKALEETTSPHKQVIFLDELPWLATKRSGFLKGLDWFWNSWANRQNVVVAICGSAASWMIEKVIDNKGGLHNRVTKRIFLAPFTLRETDQFLRSKGVNLSQYHIIQLYMAMGGIPMYLNQVKPGLSAVQNIQEICFEKRGYLRTEFSRLYASLFENANNHIEIIRALAGKRMGMTRKEIIEKTRFRNGGMLTSIIRELVQSGFVEIYNAFGKKRRQSLYRLTDPYSLFYLAFIEPLSPNSRADFTKMSDLPNYRSWSGYAYENICLMHVDQIRTKLGISGVYSTISSFYAQAENEGLPGTQIDLVIERGDQAINLCEIKFSSTEYEITKKDVESLEVRKRVFRYHTKTNKHLFTTLITTFGVIRNPNRINYVDQVVTMEDLFTA